MEIYPVAVRRILPDNPGDIFVRIKYLLEHEIDDFYINLLFLQIRGQSYTSNGKVWPLQSFRIQAAGMKKNHIIFHA